MGASALTPACEVNMSLPSRLSSTFPAVPTLGVALVTLFLGWAVSAQAEPNLMPQPALLPHYSPLCDSNLVDCLDIDSFAAHAYAHLMVLPRSEHRDSAVVIPYGVSLGLFGRVAGGVSADFSFWQLDGMARHQHGPLRLDLTALIWPILPFTQGVGSNQEGDTTYHAPVHRLRVGVHYEHQLRVGPFDGPNSLGLLMDLASLRVAATRAFGPLELTASLGALYNWQGAFATGEAAIQLGLYLPFFRALKVYGEALGRGVPRFVKNGGDSIVPTMVVQSHEAGAAEPIGRQSVLGLGLSFRPHERVDFGVSVQMGLGGLAPSAVLIRVLALSAGSGYQGRAATPIAQLASDTTVEIASAIRDYIATLPIDPQLDEHCIIHDDDGSYMGTFGKLSKNGYYCEEDSFRVPIRYTLLRDRASTMLCREHSHRELQGCLLERHGSKWVAVHRPILDGACEMYDSDGTYLGRLGTPTPDGARCRYPAERRNGGYGLATEYQELLIGRLFHTDTDRSRVCVDRAMKHCFMSPKEGRRTLAVEGNERFAKSYARHVEREVTGAAKKAEDVASGKVNLLTTVREEATQAAKTAIRIAKNPKQAALDTVTALKQAAHTWEAQTPEQKLDSMAKASAGATLSAVGTVFTGGAGSLLKGSADVLEAAAAIERLGEAGNDVITAGRRLGKAGEKTEHVLIKAEREIAERAKEPHRNRADHRPATLYEKRDKHGNHLKYGITHHLDPNKRYSKKAMNGGRVDMIERGPRREMLRRERDLVKTTGGPENREPWSGIDSCE